MANGNCPKNTGIKEICNKSRAVGWYTLNHTTCGCNHLHHLHHFASRSSGAFPPTFGPMAASVWLPGLSALGREAPFVLVRSSSSKPSRQLLAGLGEVESRSNPFSPFVDRVHCRVRKCYIRILVRFRIGMVSGLVVLM